MNIENDYNRLTPIQLRILNDRVTIAIQLNDDPYTTNADIRYFESCKMLDFVAQMKANK
jgi:hypothetical protein